MKLCREECKVPSNRTDLLIKKRAIASTEEKQPVHKRTVGKVVLQVVELLREK